MSSHHIVREKQEPALLLLGLSDFPHELLGQLLEWSPTVFAVPEAAEKLIAYGIKTDWVISDNHSEALQNDVKFLDAGKSKPAGAALDYLTKNGYPAVNIITDRLNLVDYEPYVDKINIVLFYDQKKVFPIKTGFSKWKPAGELIALLSEVANIRVSGLEKISPDLFSTTHDGFFSMNFDGPFLFIAEEL
jgi:thiamine pyrophosphokinase